MTCTYKKNNVNQELHLYTFYLESAISRREYISIENENRYNQFPVGDKQGKCECPTEKRSELFDYSAPN